MCVIIYKPAGVDIPSQALLSKAQSVNPHGCGLCSPTVTYKGLSYNSFLKALKRVSKEEPLLIHFRLATHGSIKRSNCHPFYDSETNTHFVHNGVLYGINPYLDKTDSECAFECFLQPTIKKYGLQSEELGMEVDNIIGYSKFAFMQSGQVRLFGNFVFRNGLYFSNLRFL